MARLNINVNEKLLSQLRIIAAVQDKTVTDIVVELITAYVRDKKKDALAATSEILADRNTEADKTVEEHLITEQTNGSKHDNDTLDSNETQQVTKGGKQQLNDVDRLRTILTEIASRKPQLVFIADNGEHYIKNLKEVRDELAATGFSEVKPQQPLLDGKKQKAFALPDAQKAPQATETRANDL